MVVVMERRAAGSRRRVRPVDSETAARSGRQRYSWLVQRRAGLGRAASTSPHPSRARQVSGPHIPVEKPADECSLPCTGAVMGGPSMSAAGEG